ncbi:MAG: GntR family transcriptional regulator [Lentisphaeria bacterium]|nr:GntR family transcriptional regulator [Lentisphaeria bacterium]
MLPFHVEIEDGVPVSDQLVQAVRKAVLTGQLSAGDLFPSVRALGQELRISPTTAHKVVRQLKEDGYLVSRPGIGMVVTVPALPSRGDRLRQLRPRCRDLLREAGDLGLVLADVVEVVQRTAEETGFRGLR